MKADTAASVVRLHVDDEGCLIGSNVHQEVTL